ncbi:hypothetical protein HanIR_Chr10g0490481 [Helianthus annuus]|nr:hypothetical protein HanIR_Chr10g0490481 [Helianthus annuus]
MSRNVSYPVRLGFRRTSIVIIPSLCYDCYYLLNFLLSIAIGLGQLLKTTNRHALAMKWLPFITYD